MIVSHAVNTCTTCKHAGRGAGGAAVTGLRFCHRITWCHGHMAEGTGVSTWRSNFQRGIHAGLCPGYEDRDPVSIDDVLKRLAKLEYVCRGA